jgi:transcriptional regulator with XRE-family HTH domain
MLRDVRKQANMTQADLARAIGVHQVVVSNWETGKLQIPIKHITAIVRLTGCKLEDLIKV